MRSFAFTFAFLLWATVATAQDSQPHPTLSAIAYTPITGVQRFDWWVTGTISIESWGVGTFQASWYTAVNSPEEWGQSWNGFGKRFLQREVDVTMSNAIEAGFGAMWGEDPRYIPSGRHGIMSRARYALKTAFVAQRPDGRLAPAWGRYAGNTLNNLIENTWLPPSQTTAGETALRCSLGFLSRMGGNLWSEFWPDARRRFFKR